LTIAEANGRAGEHVPRGGLRRRRRPWPGGDRKQLGSGLIFDHSLAAAAISGTLVALPAMIAMIAMVPVESGGRWHAKDGSNAS
jgi:hypothetical protein